MVAESRKMKTSPNIDGISSVVKLIRRVLCDSLKDSVNQNIYDTRHVGTN